MRLISIVSILLVLLSSCTEQDKKDNLLPNTTGKAGEIVVILADRYKETDVRDSIEKCFLQTHAGLPQEEPIFNIIVIPPHAFKNLFEKHRNIVNIDVASKYKQSSISVKSNVWAKPQRYMSITAPSDSALIKLFTNKESSILSYFIKAERSRLQNIQKRTPNLQVIEQLKNKHDIDIMVPSAYNIDKDSNNFVWISYETPQTSQGIFIYHYPYLDTAMLSKKSLISVRDSMLKHNVPGSRDGSYMTTEENFPVTGKVGKILNDKYTLELRGLWKVEHDFMGGPFLSLTTIDEKRNRVITIEGYVYAPKYKKRNYLRQLEAIMRTMKPRALEEK